MTEYSDVPQANALYSESERNQLAVSNIDAGASLISFVIGAPQMLTTIQPVVGTTMPAQQVTITLGEPASDQLMADLRQWLVDRQSAINDQLAALEVTNPPAPPGPSTAKRGSHS
jgi:hypothetical protein